MRLQAIYFGNHI